MMTPFLSDIKKSRAYQEIAGEKAREIAKTMLKKRMAPALVVEITGLSAREVRALNNELAARKN